MADTRKPTSQVVATSREREARFALQMAEQARKFGGRVAELRQERRWKQRDLVDALAALGDDSINTNQLSRYENGGAMPGEQRQSWLAEALDTTVGDLHAGPVAERGQPAPVAGPLDQLTSAHDLTPRLAAIEDKLDLIIEHLGIGEAAAGDLTLEDAPEIDQLERELAQEDDGGAALPGTGATSL